MGGEKSVIPNSFYRNLSDQEKSYFLRVFKVA